MEQRARRHRVHGRASRRRRSCRSRRFRPDCTARSRSRGVPADRRHQDRAVHLAAGRGRPQHPRPAVPLPYRARCAAMRRRSSVLAGCRGASWWRRPWLWRAKGCRSTGSRRSRFPRPRPNCGSTTRAGGCGCPTACRRSARPSATSHASAARPARRHPGPPRRRRPRRFLQRRHRPFDCRRCATPPAASCRPKISRNAAPGSCRRWRSPIATRCCNRRRG